MQIKFKKLNPDAKIPSQAREGDACWDLTATRVTITDQYTEYGTGIAIQIPEDHVGLIFPRSSISKTDQLVSNSVGVIDAGYRGEVSVRVKILGNYGLLERIGKVYEIGDRVGQVMIVPRPYLEWVEVEELSETERGTGGYGSSGK